MALDNRNPRYRRMNQRIAAEGYSEAAWQEFLEAERAAAETRQHQRQDSNRKSQSAYRQRQRGHWEGVEPVKLEVWIHPDLAARFNAYVSASGASKTAIISDALMAVLPRLDQPGSAARLKVSRVY